MLSLNLDERRLLDLCGAAPGTPLYAAVLAWIGNRPYGISDRKQDLGRYLVDELIAMACAESVKRGTSPMIQMLNDPEWRASLRRIYLGPMRGSMSDALSPPYPDWLDG